MRINQNFLPDYLDVNARTYDPLKLYFCESHSPAIYAEKYSKTVIRNDFSQRYWLKYGPSLVASKLIIFNLSLLFGTKRLGGSQLAVWSLIFLRGVAIGNQVLLKLFLQWSFETKYPTSLGNLLIGKENYSSTKFISYLGEKFNTNHVESVHVFHVTVYTY